MHGITLFRRLIEDLELCITFRIEQEMPAKTGIYMSYAERVDLIIWVIDTAYFEQHLRKFFDMENHKKERVS